MLDPAVLRFVSLTLPAAPARVLEVGAGDGKLAQALREAGYEVVAIDPIPARTRSAGCRCTSSMSPRAALTPPSPSSRCTT